MFDIPGVYSDSDAYNAVTSRHIGVTVQHAEFGRAVCDLLDTPERRRILARNAYQYVMQERTLAVCARKLAEIVETAILAPIVTTQVSHKGNTKKCG